MARIERVIETGLSSLGFSLNQGRELAACIQQLSDFYVANPGHATPWDGKFALPATLAYFMPLNYARLRSVFRELQRFVPADSISEIWDFGSGLGTTQWVLEDDEWLAPRPFYIQEISKTATDFYQGLSSSNDCRWQSRRPTTKPAPGSLAVFSYSFLEMQRQLPRLDEFDHWLILEPSTRECGRALMEWRSRFIAAQFVPLAPCTHSLNCPLLVHSPRDWCHQRIPFSQPAWWSTIEDHLPMKNRTLTYSYLLASRSVQDSTWRGSTRVIGDTLEEKGKTKQMICRGEQREFLSWLHKNGEPPRIPHGALIPDLGEVVPKGGELRPSAPLRWSF